VADSGRLTNQPNFEIRDETLKRVEKLIEKELNEPMTTALRYGFRVAHSCCGRALSSRRLRLGVLHAKRRDRARRRISVVGDALDRLRVREERCHRVDATLRFRE
jgi:hypothetical protein